MGGEEALIIKKKLRNTFLCLEFVTSFPVYTMESVKTKILSSITSTIGPCSLQIDTKEKCIIITLDAFPRHRIYVQPDRCGFAMLFAFDIA